MVLLDLVPAHIVKKLLLALNGESILVPFVKDLFSFELWKGVKVLTIVIVSHEILSYHFSHKRQRCPIQLLYFIQQTTNKSPHGYRMQYSN